MFSGPTELLLIGQFGFQKIQIKYIDTKIQFADMLTKGNFTREKWNHLLCLFNISHFSSAKCSEVMSRTQKDSGEERVTAKSKPMMSLIARAPSTLLSSASESRRRKSFESQSRWIAKSEEYDRTATPFVGRDKSRARAPPQAICLKLVLSTFTRMDDDKAWSSQEWKSDELMDDRMATPVPITFLSWNDRTRTPVVCPQRGARPPQFIIGDDETESELSLGSRSFLDRVNDKVRKNRSDLRWMLQNTTKNIL